MHCYHKEAAFGRPKTNTIFCFHWIMLGLNRQTLKSHSKLGSAAMRLCYFQAMNKIRNLYLPHGREGSNIYIEQNIAAKKIVRK